MITVIASDAQGVEVEFQHVENADDILVSAIQLAKKYPFGCVSVSSGAGKTRQLVQRVSDDTIVVRGSAREVTIYYNTRLKQYEVEIERDFGYARYTLGEALDCAAHWCEREM